MWRKNMTTLSIILPDALANESKKVARRLGLSRTQFIRQAISHELENFNTQFEQEAMVKSILAMKNCQVYLKESEEVMEGLNSTLPTEEEKWDET
jgi:metal-responsive CopG/Arc/MetJ family transcriptional regulator